MTAALACVAGLIAIEMRNADLAVVDRRKVAEYLLNAAHPNNGGKAQFFRSMGFDAHNADTLVIALRALAGEGEVVEYLESSHGEKYVVDGRLAEQTGASAPRLVRTVWIIDRGAQWPRFVSAYPVRSGTSA